MYSLTSILAAAIVTFVNAETECEALHAQWPSLVPSTTYPGCLDNHINAPSKLLNTNTTNGKEFTLIQVNGYDLTGDILKHTSDQFQSLTLIDLYNNQITGSIDSLRDLKSLTWLDLRSNTISEKLTPDLFTFCFSLQFCDLRNNFFSGEIPAGATKDKTKFLDNNCFSNAADFTLTTNPNCPVINNDCVVLNKEWPTLFPSIYAPLCLQSTNSAVTVAAQADGTGPIRALLGKSAGLTGPLLDITGLSVLTYIDVSYNQLSGPVPDSIFALYTKRPYSHFENNLLTGTIPADTQNPEHFQNNCFSNADAFGISLNPDCPDDPNCVVLHNAWASTFPKTKIADCTEYHSSEAGATISVVSVPGTTNIQSITAINANLIGPIPDLIPKPDLKTVDFSNNKLTGSVPTFMFQLDSAKLVGNLLTGTIPNNLSKLQLANLDSNCFDNAQALGLSLNPACPTATTAVVSTFSTAISTATSDAASSTVLLQTSISTATLASTFQSPSLTTGEASTMSPAASATRPVSSQSLVLSATQVSTIPTIPTSSLSSETLAVTKSFTLSTLVPTTSSCSVNTPSAQLSAIAAGPIPSGTPMKKYNGDATGIIATLNKLVPGSLNRLNANQVSSSLFQITEPISSGDPPVSFEGAPFANASNAVVVLILSSQYKFTNLPTATDIRVYNDASCTISITTDFIQGTNGVGFSYILANSYKSEWFAMQLSGDGKSLTVSVYTEHRVVASIVFPVSAGGGKRADGDVGFVVVNGVGVVNTAVGTTASTVSNAVASTVVTTSVASTSITSKVSTSAAALGTNTASTLVTSTIVASAGAAPTTTTSSAIVPTTAFVTSQTIITAVPTTTHSLTKLNVVVSQGHALLFPVVLSMALCLWH